MIYGVEPGKPTLTIPTERPMRNRFCITDEQALEVAKSVVAIEKYYSEKKGHWWPDGRGVGGGRIDQRALHRTGAA
jgi:pyruvate,water dikinase